MIHFDRRKLAGKAALILVALLLSRCGGGSGGSGGGGGGGPTLESISVTPSGPSIGVNGSQQFKATGSYSDGSMQDITASATWASSNKSVATIGANTGKAIGAGTGSTQITATLAGVTNNPPDVLTVLASSGVPALVQHVSSSNMRNNGFAASPYCYHYQLPNPTTAGNAVITGFMFSGSPTPSVMDDQGDTYTVLANHFDSADNESVAIAAAFNVAAGARVISACFASDSGGIAQPMATEFANVIGADGMGTGSDGTGMSASSGALTPSASGDLVYQIVTNVALNQTSFAAGSGANITWNLLCADLMDGWAGQYGVYGATAAVDPTMTMGTSQKWVSAAVLLKAGNAGGVPSGLRVVHLQHENIPFHTSAGSASGNPFPNPLNLEFPSSGNLLVAMIGGGNSTETVTSMTDTAGNAWSQAGQTYVISGNDTVQAYFAGNAAGSDNLGLTLNWTGGSGDFTVLLYDVTSAASSPLDTSAGNTGTQSAAGNLTMPFSITPAIADEIVFAQVIWDENTATGLLGQLFDSNSFDGESVNGPEPVDENNGWGHVITANTNTLMFTWTALPNGGSVGNWAGMAVAFKGAN